MLPEKHPEPGRPPGPCAAAGGGARTDLRDKIYSSLISRQQDDSDFATLAASAAAESAPPSLKSRIYSALMARQAESGPLLSLPVVKAGGRGLCVFEELVRIAPVGEKLKSFNYCRICRARVVAERMNSAPIYWPKCPYVGFQDRIGPICRTGSGSVPDAADLEATANG